MIKISCIIPAYNEGPRIKNVLTVVATHPLIDEIIVVDDGSSDDTKKVVLDFIQGFQKIKFIPLEKNSGKSTALYNGIKSSTGEYVFFLDADLVGLNVENITAIISPILDGSSDVSMSLRGNAQWWGHAIGMDYISGERILPRKIITPHLEEILKLKPFGFEVFLNRFIIKNNSRIKVTLWPNVASPYKIRKNGFWKGVKGDFFMALDIVRTIYIWGPLYQIIKMRTMKVE